MARCARHTSHVTRHTSHVTRHTSHVTRHTSHVTRHTLHSRLCTIISRFLVVSEPTTSKPVAIVMQLAHPLSASSFLIPPSFFLSFSYPTIFPLLLPLTSCPPPPLPSSLLHPLSLPDLSTWSHYRPCRQQPPHSLSRPYHRHLPSPPSRASASGTIRCRLFLHLRLSRVTFFVFSVSCFHSSAARRVSPTHWTGCLQTLYYSKGER